MIKKPKNHGGSSLNVKISRVKTKLLGYFFLFVRAIDEQQYHIKVILLEK